MDACDFKEAGNFTKKRLLPIAGKSEIAATELNNCIDEISAIFQKYYDHGLEPRQIAQSLLEVSLTSMLFSADRKAAYDFTDYTQWAGARVGKIIANNPSPSDEEE